MKNLSLQSKLLLLGVVISIVPMILIAFFVNAKGGSIAGIASGALLEKGMEQMKEELDGSLRLIEQVEFLLKEDIEKVLRVAEDFVLSEGGVHFDGDPVEWKATNQFTGKVREVSLPAARLGNGKALPQTNDFKVEVPLVDRVGKVTRDTATLFQRMNSHGDMLRIATNVNSGGKRATGTYIPATNPDGQPNPVVATVLRGKTFIGRAFVVDQWYVTAYAPIHDKSGEVTGILYVGTPESVATESILRELGDIRFGESGYLYILNTRGANAGRYVLSLDHARDGEVILDSTDKNGEPFVRRMVERAQDLKVGEIEKSRYLWQNPGDPEPRMKFALYAYYPNWDWLVAVSAYEDEFYRKSEELASIVNGIVRVILLLALVIGTAAIAAMILLTRSIALPIGRILNELMIGGRETEASSQQVSSASQTLANGANEQAAALEETNATLVSLSDMIKQSLSVARETRLHSGEAKAASGEGIGSVKELGAVLEAIRASMEGTVRTMEQIQSSNHAVTKIIGTIDDIAFQTNILALNASVEAARAGEAGAGFAVVAEEVRNLASRAATAAKETGAMIERSVAAGNEGVKANASVAEQLSAVETAAGSVRDCLSKINEQVELVNSAMGIIEGNAESQTEGIGEINSAIDKINEVTQEAAASSEETASASEELNAQAVQLTEIVGRLGSIISGEKATRKLLQVD